MITALGLFQIEHIYINLYATLALPFAYWRFFLVVLDFTAAFNKNFYALLKG